MAERLVDIGKRGEKAIVFCQWEELKQKIADALASLGIRHFTLGGSVFQRSAVIRRFQEERGDDAIPVLLLSLEHSASGTNLTAANHIVFVHPFSDNAVRSGRELQRESGMTDRAVAYEAQAIGRCRRQGQEHTAVHLWRFVVRGTVEETITAQHRCDLWEHHLRQTSAA